MLLLQALRQAVRECCEQSRAPLPPWGSMLPMQWHIVAWAALVRSSRNPVACICLIGFGRVDRGGGQG